MPRVQKYRYDIIQPVLSWTLALLIFYALFNLFIGPPTNPPAKTIFMILGMSGANFIYVSAPAALLATGTGICTYNQLSRPKTWRKVLAPSTAVLATFTAGLLAASIIAYTAQIIALSKLGAQRCYIRPLAYSMMVPSAITPFYPHAAAIKNCTPYIWSYQHMAFEQIPTNTAKNVLPDNWVHDCRNNWKKGD